MKNKGIKSPTYFVLWGFVWGAILSDGLETQVLGLPIVGWLAISLFGYYLYYKLK